MEKTCDQMLLEDGVQRLGAGISQGFTTDLLGKAKTRMAEEGYWGLLMISTIYDKRQKCIAMAWFVFKGGAAFTVQYGGAGGGAAFTVQYGKVRNGRIDALSKTLFSLGKQIDKMPPMILWPPTVEKEFVVTTFSFPWDCESCRIFRFVNYVCMVIDLPFYFKHSAA